MTNSDGTPKAPAERFTSRVEHYRKYRPGYPIEMIEFLQRELRLSPASRVADVGSGTGLLTALLLQQGYRVFAVEPNRAMRQAAEEAFSGHPRLTSIDGSAEKTHLPSHSMALVIAAQSFHWFEREKARGEFCRILEPGGWVALIWNSRKTRETEFLRAYEDLLIRFSIDYQQVNHQNVGESELQAFFARCHKKTFANRQTLNFEGLRGRMLSSSYAPLPGHPNFDPMMQHLQAIFQKYQQNGYVTLEYDTVVYYGHLNCDG